MKIKLEWGIFLYLLGCCFKNDKVIIFVGEYVERKGFIDMFSVYLV